MVAHCREHDLPTPTFCETLPGTLGMCLNDPNVGQVFQHHVFLDRKKPQEIRCLAFQLLDAFHGSDPNTFIDPNTFRRTWVEMLYHAALMGGFHV